MVASERDARVSGASIQSRWRCQGYRGIRVNRPFECCDAQPIGTPWTYISASVRRNCWTSDSLRTTDAPVQTDLPECRSTASDGCAEHAVRPDLKRCIEAIGKGCCYRGSEIGWLTGATTPVIGVVARCRHAGAVQRGIEWQPRGLIRHRPEAGPEVALDQIDLRMMVGHIDVQSAMEHALFGKFGSEHRQRCRWSRHHHQIRSQNGADRKSVATAVQEGLGCRQPQPDGHH